MEEKKTSRPAVDWDAMAPEWRAGVVSVMSLSKEYGVSRAAIIKHWRIAGVERDLSAKIQAKAESLVTHAEVTPEVTAELRVTETAVIEANAKMLADRVIHQRTDISRARATVQRLWAMVDAELDHPGDFANVGELLRSEDEFGQDKLNDLYRAAISLPQQVKNAKLLADALKVLIELERKVLKLDSLAESDEAKRAGEEAGRAVAAGVDAAMAALNEKLASHRP